LQRLRAFELTLLACFNETWQLLILEGAGNIQLMVWLSATATHWFNKTNSDCTSRPF
jgi:hypothetical protein